MDYGICDYCNGKLTPVWFIEEERDNHNIKTGRERQAVSHLVCSNCLANFVVDDSFDGAWYYPWSYKL